MGKFVNTLCPISPLHTFSRKYFGNESPLGRRVRLFNPAQPQPWRNIVGVVPDTLMQGPFNQQTDRGGFLHSAARRGAGAAVCHRHR